MRVRAEIACMQSVCYPLSWVRAWSASVDEDSMVELLGADRAHGDSGLTPALQGRGRGRERGRERERESESESESERESIRSNHLAN